MSDWDAERYLEFETLRTQPCKDLVARIELDRVEKIVDIGCGPGNSTEVLSQRWPDAKLVGLDHSNDMLAKAKASRPSLEFQVFDACIEKLPQGQDIVFSNAALQWMPDHDIRLREWHMALNPGGVLAVQIPYNFETQMQLAVRKTLKQKRWKGLSVDSPNHSLKEPGQYYDVLSTLSDQVCLWQTSYEQVMESYDELLAWVESTTLRPYLSALDNATDRSAFKADLLAQIEAHFSRQRDGKVIFPFNRLFFISRKT